jgi:hypothetical protein
VPAVLHVPQDLASAPGLFGEPFAQLFYKARRIQQALQLIDRIVHGRVVTARLVPADVTGRRS